jgi:hypothetical protein
MVTGVAFLRPPCPTACLILTLLILIILTPCCPSVRRPFPRPCPCPVTPVCLLRWASLLDGPCARCATMPTWMRPRKDRSCPAMARSSRHRKPRKAHHRQPEAAAAAGETDLAAAVAAVAVRAVAAVPRVAAAAALTRRMLPLRRTSRLSERGPQRLVCALPAIYFLLAHCFRLACKRFSLHFLACSKILC